MIIPGAIMDKKNLKKILREKLVLLYGDTHQKKLSKQDIVTGIDKICELLKKEQNITVAKEDKDVLVSQITDDLLGWGPLEVLMKDGLITEIMINGPSAVYVEKKGKKVLTDVKFDDEQHLRYIIERMISPTGRRVDESSPYVDFSLRDGSRVNVILPPLVVAGPTVTIRKFLTRIQTLDDLVEFGTLNKRMADFLFACIKAKINIIFAGATGVGKTTTLEVLSSYLDKEERIITIEDALELHLRQDHVVSLLTRHTNIEGKGGVTIRDLFTNTLRMRPSRIILGEIRGAEALDYLQALNSGHRGCLAVIHASSPEDVVTRLETMVFYSGTNLPIWAIRKQIVQGLDLVVQQDQLVDGSRKITRISQIKKLDSQNNIIIDDLFYFQQKDIAQEGAVRGEFISTGTVPFFMDKFQAMGIQVPLEMFKKEE